MRSPSPCFPSPRRAKRKKFDSHYSSQFELLCRPVVSTDRNTEHDVPSISTDSEVPAAATAKVATPLISDVGEDLPEALASGFSTLRSDVTFDGDELEQLASDEVVSARSQSTQSKSAAAPSSHSSLSPKKRSTRLPVPVVRQPSPTAPKSNADSATASSVASARSRATASADTATSSVSEALPPQAKDDSTSISEALVRLFDSYLSCPVRYLLFLAICSRRIFTFSTYI